MKIHRFYIPHIEISPEKLIVTQETELIHQLKNVFRYKIGQIIHIFNESAGEMEVEIVKIDKKEMFFKYIDQMSHIDSNKGHTKEVHLYMSIIKNSNFDLIVEKAVELGISKIIPVISERVIKNKLNYERLSKIIKEATEQSGRVSLMKIGETVNLEDAINHACAHPGTVYFGSTVENEGLKYNSKESDDTTSIFIGPEGGYSESEIESFKKQKIQPIRLGDHVLRAETAAIVACGLMSL